MPQGVDRQLLTAAFPVTASGVPNGPATGCQADASDNGASAPGIVDAYAVNLLLDRAMLTASFPRRPGAGTDVQLVGSHFPSNMPVTVQFVGPVTQSVQSFMPNPNDPTPRGTVLTVPHGLPARMYKVGILQAGLPDPVTQILNFTVTP